MLAAMSKRVDTKIEDASRDAELERAKEELTAATREAGRLQAEVSALRGDKAIAEDRLAEVERSVEKVAARLEAARACQDVDVNQLAHKLGLYMTVCPIKWDLDAPEGVLRGRESVVRSSRSSRDALRSAAQRSPASPACHCTHA